MHNAFNVLPVLQQLPVQVECAAVYSDRLLLGTSTGALLVYRVVEPTPDKPLAITLTETKKTFARKAVERLEVIKEAGVLACLADGLVTLYDLHTFGNATPLGNTKGANLIAAYTAVDHIDNIPTLVSKLAIHARRRIVVLEWRDAEFYQSSEYNAANKITALQFAAPGLLILSTAREFLTLQLPEGQWDDLFPADVASIRTVAGSGLANDDTMSSKTGSQSDSGGGGGWGAWAMGLSGGGGSSSEIKTIVARMPNERLLLCHEGVAVFISSAGKLCHTDYTKPMQFGFAPSAITHTSSYAIAITSAATSSLEKDVEAHNIEVRNIGTQALVQSLSLNEEPPMLVLNGSGGKQIWAIGHHTVWRLMPAPIQQQVEDVLQAEQYDEALALVERSDNILEEERKDLTVKIRWLRARYMFREEARYEEALAEFTDLEATPTEAIALCPERIAGELAEDDSDPGLSPTENDEEEEEIRSSLKEATPKRQVIWREALHAMMRYLTEHRRWLQRATTEKKRDLEYVVRVVDDEDKPKHSDDDFLPHVRLKRLAFVLERMHIPVAAMAQVVDTTLLRVYLECIPGLVGPLLRVKNHCDVEQSESLLLNHRRYAELVDLYHGKRLYRNALQLLQSQGSDVSSTTTDNDSRDAHNCPLKGTCPIVRYLLRLPADQFDLVLEYVRWPLEAVAPSNATRRTSSACSDDDEDDIDWPAPATVVAMVFADDRPAAVSFPRSRVASFLRQISPNLAVQYLTYVFETWDDQTPVLHDDMVASLLEILLSLPDYSHDDSHIANLRLQLQQFLRTSKPYSPEKALARLPDDGLYEERALVLGRLGRHEQALCILVFSVGDLPMAEQYCIENSAECAQVYVVLLKILVLPSPPADIQDNEIGLIRADSITFDDPKEQEAEVVRQRIHRQFAGHLLSTHYQSIPAADALRILPSDMPFGPDTLTYLHGQLCMIDQNMRACNIICSLRAGKDLHSRRQLQKQRSGHVVISEHRKCPHCFKRVGSGTAFVVLPATSEHVPPNVVHYSCWQRQKPQQPVASSETDVSSNSGVLPSPQIELKWA